MVNNFMVVLIRNITLNVKSIIKEKDVIRGSHEQITDNIWDFYQ